jgi:hypothetical protein
MVQQVKSFAHAFIMLLILFMGYILGLVFHSCSILLLVLLSFIMLTLAVSEFVRTQEKEWKRKHGGCTQLKSVKKPPVRESQMNV